MDAGDWLLWRQGVKGPKTSVKSKSGEEAEGGVMVSFFSFVVNSE